MARLTAGILLLLLLPCALALSLRGNRQHTIWQPLTLSHDPLSDCREEWFEGECGASAGRPTMAAATAHGAGAPLLQPPSHCPPPNPPTKRRARRQLQQRRPAHVAAPLLCVRQALGQKQRPDLFLREGGGGVGLWGLKGGTRLLLYDDTKLTHTKTNRPATKGLSRRTSPTPA